jgi:hypothetical protein
MSAHEAVCAERWAAIKSRMSRMEGIIIVSSGTIILGLFGVLGFLLPAYLHSVK